MRWIRHVVFLHNNLLSSQLSNDMDRQQHHSNRKLINDFQEISKIYSNNNNNMDYEICISCFSSNLKISKNDW